MAGKPAPTRFSANPVGAGPLVIIFQAAHSAQLSAAELSSWVWAISIGSGLLGVILSLWRRAPQVGRAGAAD
ncbi:benzoate/H(+) symporter BenE family transporter [Pseudomonas sp. RC2C2]|nr:benzoate/H(+) symporter BenE family transporter [Pseudomonas sp. RC2C2]